MMIINQRSLLCLFARFIQLVFHQRCKGRDLLVLTLFGELLEKVGRCDLLVSKGQLRFWCSSASLMLIHWGNSFILEVITLSSCVEIRDPGQPATCAALQVAGLHCRRI